MKKAEKKNKGFSLIELIVVVLIIGVIGIALAPQVIKWVDESKTNADRNNAESIQSSVQAALVDWQNNGGKLTGIDSTGDGLVTYSVKNGVFKRTSTDTEPTTSTGATLISFVSQVTGDDYPTANTKYGTDKNDYVVEVYNTGKVLVKFAAAPTVAPTPVPTP